MYEPGVVLRPKVFWWWLMKLFPSTSDQYICIMFPVWRPPDKWELGISDDGSITTCFHLTTFYFLSILPNSELSKLRCNRRGWKPLLSHVSYTTWPGQSVGPEICFLLLSSTLLNSGIFHSDGLPMVSKIGSVVVNLGVCGVKNGICGGTFGCLWCPMSLSNLWSVVVNLGVCGVPFQNLWSVVVHLGVCGGIFFTNS